MTNDATTAGMIALGAVRRLPAGQLGEAQRDHELGAVLVLRG